MRLWSIHPHYLDAKGLVALWRETLLAQQVLRGKTRGYRHHPQLIRFRESGNPAGAVAAYLRVVAAEADARGYAFDKSKIGRKRFEGVIEVTEGQVRYEFDHLLSKLMTRNPALYEKIRGTQEIRLHPLFTRIAGEVADWETVQAIKKEKE